MVDITPAILLTLNDSSILKYGEVLELADRQDLGSCAARRGGSTPPFPTTAPIFSNASI
jgi:hypothetical protein